MGIKKQPASDFDADSLVKSDKHEKDVAELKGRIENLENRVGNNECMATTILEASKSQKQVDEMLVGSLISLLQKNEDVKTALYTQIDSYDRKAVNKFIKSWGGKLIALIGAILLLIIGAIISTIIPGYFGK